MILIERLRLRAWIPVVALAVTAVLVAFPLMGGIERMAGDVQHKLVARNMHFNDAVVIDIDEASLRGLKPFLGDWPYRRDIYGRLLDYLNEHGVATVVFDIVMADRRAGDETFAESLCKHGNGVLAVAAPTGDINMTEREVGQLARMRRPALTSLPRVSWPSLLLPNDTLLDGAPSVVVGVAAAVADSDGVLRRMPLMHETQGRSLPSLPLAAMDAAGRRGGTAPDPTGTAMPWPNWPLDADGLIHLYFPANADSVLTLPFQDVAEAALGLSTLRDAEQFFRGKTVFIGSTAYLADRVNTPRGTMSGTYVLATMHQTLQQGLAWRPPTVGGNALLVSLAIAALFTLLAIPNLTWRISLIWAGLSVAAVWIVHTALLAVALQEAALSPPLLVLLIGWAAHTLSEHGSLRRRARELEREVDLDSLTGLPVRRALMRTFSRDIAVARRRSQPLTVAILDLDHFKRVNDTFGHPTGDLVLKAFAGVSQRCLRASDSVGRWGGEEFVVLLPDTDSAGAVVVLDKIRIAVGQESFPAPAHSLKVTLSGGIVQYNGNDQTPEELLYEADCALYRAKESGRNRICVAGGVRLGAGTPQPTTQNREGEN